MAWPTRRSSSSAPDRRAAALGSVPPELELTEMADPSPAPDEVLLTVTACG